MLSALPLAQLILKEKAAGAPATLADPPTPPRLLGRAPPTAAASPASVRVSCGDWKDDERHATAHQVVLQQLDIERLLEDKEVRVL